MRDIAKQAKAILKERNNLKKLPKLDVKVPRDLRYLQQLAETGLEHNVKLAIKYRLAAER